jgi:hypothetical protein
MTLRRQAIAPELGSNGSAEVEALPWKGNTLA